MNTLSFYLAIFLAIVYAAIMVGQARENRALDEAMAQQHSFQIKLLRAEEKNQFTHQFVQRIAGESIGDPALVKNLPRPRHRHGHWNDRA